MVRKESGETHYYITLKNNGGRCPSNNAFDPSFELEYLKPNETYKIDYYIELN